MCTISALAIRRIQSIVPVAGPQDLICGAIYFQAIRMISILQGKNPICNEDVNTNGLQIYPGVRYGFCNASSYSAEDDSEIPGDVVMVFRSLATYAYTLFLFTKSDVKAILIPIICFAVAAAPDLQIGNIPHSVCWLWLHLLQFDVSNQTLSEEEDKENKNDRPLPAGRMTLRGALILRWVLVPLCWSYSLFFSIKTFYASLSVVALTYIYDEMGGHSGHWIVRNALNALGFASFEVGATLVAARNRSALDDIAILAIYCSAGVVATTVHTQDFKDVKGDQAIGRRTLPIIHPGFARLAIPVLLLPWSIGLGYRWNLHPTIAIAFTSLGAVTSYRFFVFRSISQDRISFWYYIIWLSIAHLLPGYYRYYGCYHI